MKKLHFDFNNMLSINVGKEHGVTDLELKKMKKDVAEAHQHLKSLLTHPINRISLNLEWTRLANQDKKFIRKIQALGSEIARKYENVISLGIGGSYLGLKAAQDALTHPYYNEFSSLRAKRPRIYFEGNNLDPETLNALLKNLNPKKTFVIVISKSGETTETKAAFQIVQRWLKRKVGAKFGRQIIAITDPVAGSLRKLINEVRVKDSLSFRSLSLLKGVGGRFSELNMGLLHLAIIGVKIEEVFAGARAMAKRCNSAAIYKNPAYMYALLQTILYQKKKKSISVLMPFSETLKSTADWYVQLLAESLGKKYTRVIKKDTLGVETWSRGKVVNLGRTPISARGTNDLHSIQQNNIEGENNKTTTFIRIESFCHDLTTPPANDFLGGKSYATLLKVAHEATEWALARERRPNCTITMPSVSPYHWGELIYFFELATAFEGELLGVNAYDQPGVESYKNYMYYKLKKLGISKKVGKDILRNPMIKKDKFLL